MKDRSPSAGTPFIRVASVHDPHMISISRRSSRWWVSVHGSKLMSRLAARVWEGEGDSSTIIPKEDKDVEEEAGEGNWAWRAWTIPLVARMSLTCESVIGETEGSGGTEAPTTGEGVRVERGDGEAVHITANTIPGATSRSRVDLSACLFPCFRGRGGTSREGAAVMGMEGGGPERGRGGGAQGAGVAKAALPFGKL